MNNVVWQPITPETTIECDCEHNNLCTEMLSVDSDSMVSFENEAGYWSIELPDYIRLCRAVPLPQPDWANAPGWAMWWAVEPNGPNNLV